MKKFYRVNIRMIGTNYVDNDPQQGEDPTTTECFNIQSHEFDTLDDVRAFLKEQYGENKPTYSYNGRMEPIVLTYEFDNADWLHTPVIPWAEFDDVGVFLMTSTRVPVTELGIEADI